LITRIIFGDEYRSLSSSLCSLLHSPVVSSLLGPNILLSTLFFPAVQLTLTFQNLAVTLRTTRFNTKISTWCPHCVYVFCTDLRTNSNFYLIKH
jgi:hypothetical protein